MLGEGPGHWPGAACKATWPPAAAAAGARRPSGVVADRSRCWARAAAWAVVTWARTWTIVRHRRRGRRRRHRHRHRPHPHPGTGRRPAAPSRPASSTILRTIFRFNSALPTFLLLEGLCSLEGFSSIPLAAPSAKPTSTASNFERFESLCPASTARSDLRRAARMCSPCALSRGMQQQKPKLPFTRGLQKCFRAPVNRLWGSLLTE